ncbi:hypothetical protein BCR42DRAFT_2987 [Absidia repens]|uniref:Uncharacterized protein n=1 Tax=Absidia repens TaxID=90262 RepID=A0A1X2J073_9FUNG|nr:hypothetical protein BCR42DRAFT_2987 [Absidia repens]
MNPVPLGLITGAGFFMGSQIGFGTGAMAGINTIKSLPNPDKLVNLVKEVQTDMLAARGLVIDGPRTPPRPMTEKEKQEYQQKLNDRNEQQYNNKSMDVWQQQQQQQVPPTAANSNPDQSVNNNGQTDAWDRIRNNEQQQQRQQQQQQQEQRQQQPQQEQDIWGDVRSKYRDNTVAAETEWMDRNGSVPSTKPTKNKWGDDMS